MTLVDYVMKSWMGYLFVEVVRHFLYSKRVYRSNSTSESMIDNLVTALYSIKGIRLGTEVFRSQNIPLFLISWETIVVVQVETIGMQGNMCATFTVYRWNWGAVKGQPIIPDNIQRTVQADTINILESSGNRAEDMYLKRMTELTLPPNGIDSRILCKSQSVAQAIVDDYNAGGNAAKVFILHGKPGCGKSTTLRLITKLVNGTLFADYNPTGVHTVRTIISDGDDSQMVIGYEEFDVSFKKIVAGNVSIQYDRLIPDAKDKASWTSLLDYLKRKQHVIFVMVTNKSLEDIEEMTCGDESFLRYGRVDAHFVWPEGDDEAPKKINKIPFAVDSDATSSSYMQDDSSKSDSTVGEKKKKNKYSVMKRLFTPRYFRKEGR